MFFKEVTDDLYKMKLQAQTEGNHALRSIARSALICLRGSRSRFQGVVGTVWSCLLILLRVTPLCNDGGCIIFYCLIFNFHYGLSRCCFELLILKFVASKAACFYKKQLI